MSNWIALRPFETTPVFVADTVEKERAYRDSFLWLDDNRTSLLAHGRQHTMNVLQGVLEHPQGISPFKREILSEVFAEKKDQQRNARNEAQKAEAAEERRRERAAEDARADKQEIAAQARENRQETLTEKQANRSFHRDAILVALGAVLGGAITKFLL